MSPGARAKGFSSQVADIIARERAQPGAGARAGDMKIAVEPVLRLHP